MENNYLKDLINEVRSRDGGLILSMDGQPEAVVLSINKYNGLLQSLTANVAAKTLLSNSKENEQNDIKNILVTGGAGYIGAHVAKCLLEAGFNVIILDNLSSGKIENVPKNSEFIEGDVKDLNLLRDIFSKSKIDSVMHLAALIEVEESVREPLKYFENNVLATANLLYAMNEAGVKKIIFSSTCAVYDSSESGLFSETSAVRPTNPYGNSKLIAENIIKYYCEHLAFNAVVFRYFNACGLDTQSSISPTHDSHLIAKILQVAKGNLPFLMVNGIDYNTHDGSCVRDYVHVIDIARAHLVALQALNFNEKYQIYNIGTGKGLSVLEVANTAAEILNKMVPMEIGPRRQGDAKMAVANNSKIKSELGFELKYSDLETIIKSSWSQI